MDFDGIMFKYLVHFSNKELDFNLKSIEILALEPLISSNQSNFLFALLHHNFHPLLPMPFNFPSLEVMHQPSLNHQFNL